MFGSHLYGTNTQTSDVDIKGIAFQSSRDFILNGPRKHIEYSSTGNNSSKNTSEDVDIEIYTISQFIKHSLSGQTVSLDLLHCPDNMLIESSHYWQFIRKNRSKFYSKNIHSFLSYCKLQASKYGIKGSRLSDAKNVLDWLDFQLKYLTPEEKKTTRISQCDISTFPKGDHINIIYLNECDILFQVCGKKFQSTVKVEYAKEIIQKFYDAYGERARLAANNENIDWKAISHAFRAAYQTKELFTEGDITFPLKDAEFIKKVKAGELLYTIIGPMLEDLIDEVTEIKDKCSLPETPDKEFWDNWLYEIIQDRIKRGV
jgi:predicted nucleotidyltransferase